MQLGRQSKTVRYSIAPLHREHQHPAGNARRNAATDANTSNLDYGQTVGKYPSITADVPDPGITGSTTDSPNVMASAICGRYTDMSR